MSYNWTNKLTRDYVIKNEDMDEIESAISSLTSNGAYNTTVKSAPHNTSQTTGNSTVKSAPHNTSQTTGNSTVKSSPYNSTVNSTNGTSGNSTVKSSNYTERSFM